ncbi:MAG: ATP-dependent Clp protease adapter ClpS [Verrucomicrobiota bacterium]
MATVTEIEAIPEIDVEDEDSLAPVWNVVIWNDPVNLMSFVTLVIRRIFGYSEAKATELMLMVHEKGKAIVWTGEQERAEFFVQQLQGHQLLASMQKV